ncbi:MAG TPA: hypothetical protein VGH72_30020, partial [Pseudonocardia sp.]
MRILVLGGTVFLSHAVAVGALARGHRVSCLARGVSGSVPAGARLLVADRDSPGALAAAVDGESFDAVVDVATMSLPWVSEALAALAGSVGHWTFISSINVYADKATPGRGSTRHCSPRTSHRPARPHRTWIPISTVPPRWPARTRCCQLSGSGRSWSGPGCSSGRVIRTTGSATGR